MATEGHAARTLTSREVADALGVTPRTVQRWVAEGRLPAVRVGGRIRFAAEAVRQLELAAAAPLAETSGVVQSSAGPSVRPIRTLLIANRGEIAARIARTARRLGIRTVAVHRPGERPHGDFDAQHEIPGYLDGDTIIAVAARSGADAIHPGYGFLAENSAFADAVERAGIAWVGPPATAISAMGDKAQARRTAAAHDVPVLPGYDGPEQDDARLRAEAETVGWPLLVKPAAGGGGKGMRLVRGRDALDEALAGARREAAAAFGDDRLILERFLEGPRHVEVQLLFDGHGNGVHLGPRDCSAQRRQQKIVEEAPAPSVDAALRSRIGQAALAVGASVGYTNAGTAEFLLADDGSFYFLEMNTRLQVEHPVTELVTGRDLVADQLRIAAGEPLGFTQDEVAFDGHAIEARLYAEDAEHGFLPATGTIVALEWPSGAGVRVDAGVDAGDEVTPHYDPLLAKVIAHGNDRAEALARLTAALDSTLVLGLRTNLRFLRWLLRQPFFVAAETRTDTLAAVELPGEPDIPDAAWREAAHALLRGREPADGDGDGWSGGWRLNAPPAIRLRSGDVERRLELASGETGSAVVAGETAFVDVEGLSMELAIAAPPSLEAAVRHAAQEGSAGAVLTAPMPGRVISIRHAVGDQVAQNEPVVVLEAMKMENAVTAPIAGSLAVLHVAVGQQVQRGEVLAEVSA